ncbi:DMT family transporter [Silicimonas sp. MF1-12-2]|uniref:DMT family transporter n=1 Tax=Silicimonas sp. MF1-12-2 TaxID=3384793 RepID=UPI0039B43923
MDIKAILGGLAFAFMWSSAFTSARIIVTNAPPLTVSAFRFLVAGVIVLLLARVFGQSLRLNAQQWKLTIVFGICQNALYLGLNFVAMQWVEASLAAIIAASLPLWVGVSGWLIWGERVPALGTAGLIAGIAGVMLIMGTRISAGVDPLGVVLCVLGALALTFATLAVRGASSGGNLLTVVGFQMLIGSAALWVPALSFETWQVNWSPLVIGAFLYTIFVPGILATILWFWLVGRIGATRAATFHFLNPFLGVVIASALLGESLGWLDAVGVAVITAGILAVQMSKVRV